MTDRPFINLSAPPSSAQSPVQWSSAGTRQVAAGGPPVPPASPVVPYQAVPSPLHLDRAGPDVAPSFWPLPSLPFRAPRPSPCSLPVGPAGQSGEWYVEILMESRAGQHRGRWNNMRYYGHKNVPQQERCPCLSEQHRSITLKICLIFMPNCLRLVNDGNFKRSLNCPKLQTSCRCNCIGKGTTQETYSLQDDNG